jgi:hypothetical protein
MPTRSLLQDSHLHLSHRYLRSFRRHLQIDYHVHIGFTGMTKLRTIVYMFILPMLCVGLFLFFNFYPPAVKCKQLGGEYFLDGGCVKFTYEHIKLD